MSGLGVGSSDASSEGVSDTTVGGGTASVTSNAAETNSTGTETGSLSSATNASRGESRLTLDFRIILASVAIVALSGFSI